MLSSICSFYNPVVSEKLVGEIIFVYPTASNQNFQYSSSSCVYSGQLETIATSTQKTINGFTYGDILTNYFIFIILIGCVAGFLINKFVKFSK